MAKIDNTETPSKAQQCIILEGILTGKSPQHKKADSYYLSRVRETPTAFQEILERCVSMTRAGCANNNVKAENEKLVSVIKYEFL